MQLPCLPEMYLKPSNLDISVLWTCSVGSYGVRITGVNSNFGRCGLLRWHSANLFCSRVEGLPKRTFSFVTKEVLI